MGSIFGTLGIGYSGLSTSQSAIDVTSNNIANANNESYTRQRVIIGTNPPLAGVVPGDLGQGSKVLTIERVHDEFIYRSYRNAQANSEYSNQMSQTLEEMSKYFPDMDGIGLQNDLATYFNSWQSFAQNPNDTSQKVALSRNSQTLATSIQSLSAQLGSLQTSLNDRMVPMVNEVNDITKQIASINTEITKNESNDVNKANDLRDQRDKLEQALYKLIQPTVTKSNMVSNANTGTYDHTKEQYVLQLGGYTLIDGSSSHDLIVKPDEDSPQGFNTIYYERQDHHPENITERVIGGRLGALMDLRGRRIDPSTGTPEDGKVQETIDNLNTYAKGLLNATNNIYASSAQKTMISNTTTFAKDAPLIVGDSGLREGSFDVVIYGPNGEEVARRSMSTDQSTTLRDIEKQFNKTVDSNADIDDNKDNNSLNDFDDYGYLQYQAPSTVGANTGLITLKVNDTYADQGYRVAIIDNGSNFAGAFGLGRFFDGNDAHNIDLKSEFKNDSSLINGYGPNIDGNNETANAMMQLQYDSIMFQTRYDGDKSDTLGGFYRFMTTTLSSYTAAVNQQKETGSAYLSTVQLEYESVSKVSTDEELTNLMRYQTGYSAAAKVITTIDQMIDTLLGLKQ